MAVEIRVPRLGWSMEEGTFVGWRKGDGERVAVGDALYELEGEKATQEIEASDAGILHIAPNGPRPGTIVPVGTLLGCLLADGESAPRARPPETAARQENSTANLNRAATVAVSVIHASPAAASPKRHASPRARRLARKLAIDWRKLDGTGRSGRIREADIERAANRSLDLPPDCAVVTLSPIRKTIAERMRRIRERTAPVTLTTRADASAIVALRRKRQSTEYPADAPTYLDLVVAIVARVLPRHALLAARWRADESLVIPTGNRIDVGIAVDTRDGLLVPVLRNVAVVSLGELAAQSRVLIERTRSGELRASDLRDGMFTITNLGSFGIDGFTPVIHYPEVAILGLGAIRRELVVMPDDSFAVRDCVTLSLTFDHCAVDGAPAAACLRDIRASLESPPASL